MSSEWSNTPEARVVQRVGCRDCGSAPGEVCKTKSGQDAKQTHVCRERFYLRRFRA